MELRLENLTKRFSERLAVEIPSLVVREGEFFTFVGPSGCGKSTTLNLIAGLEEPTSGTLSLGERKLNELPPHRRDIAFVFQSYALYPHRTVFGNLAFPLELAGVPRAERRARVEEAAQLLGLGALLEKRPAQLSGGERQRVALGRAIVRKPKLFLFDEPLSNLDAPLRAAMRKELKRIHRQLGTTFLYVTHDQEEALSLSDRIAVMDAGRIRQCGTPAEVYERPADTFVALFFGSPPMNLFDGKIYVEGPPARLRVAEWECPVDTALSAGTRSGPVRAGIRPEHVLLSGEAMPQARQGHITWMEPHGSQIYLEAEAGGLRLLAVERAGAGFRAGDRVWISLAADRLHLFDADSGARINADSSRPVGRG